MWIRSQNRNVLVNADKFSVSKEHEVFRIYSVNSFLGEYSTEEKAMKAMDMIEDAIIKYESMINVDTIFFDERKIVFQIPKDDEVDYEKL